MNTTTKAGAPERALPRGGGATSQRFWLSLAVVGALAGCGRPADDALPLPHTVESGLPEREIVLVPRIPYLVTYPCASQCHDDREPNPERRELTEFHSDRVLDHGEGIGWCDSCHALDDTDHLHLIDGTLYGFDESQHLCGQCHGPQYRDWQQGFHGSLTGGWYGTTERRLCTACHDPHNPRGLIHLQSLPAPSPAPGYEELAAGGGEE